MIAETNRIDKLTLQEWMARLASLFATVVILIQKGSRSREMTESLFKALQLFKEEKLGKVLSLSESASGDTSDKMELPQMMSVRFHEIIDISVERLPLSGRAKNACRNSNIRTLRELLKRTERELYYTKNLGTKTLNEIRSFAEGMGCVLGMSEPEIERALEYSRNTPLLR